jgi:hypothetical protein
VPVVVQYVCTEDRYKESIRLVRDANKTSPKCKPEAILCDVTSPAFIFSRETFFNTPSEVHAGTKTSES